MERPIKFVTRVKPDTPLAVDLFGLGHDAARFEIERSNEVDLAIAAQAPVFIGVSGRRDSQALAYRGCDHRLSSDKIRRQPWSRHVKVRASKKCISSRIE